MRLRFDDAAIVELNDAALWYEGKQAGLGAEFLEAVLQRAATLAADPIGGPVPGVSHDVPARRVLMGRFPFAIVLVVAEDEVRVIAIAHGKLQPLQVVLRTRCVSLNLLESL